MLGSFDPDSLDLYNQLVEAEMPMEYSEDAENYDFARCVRADGSAYGTRGRCRLGTESGPAEKPAPKMKAASPKAEALKKTAAQMKANAAGYLGSKAAKIDRGPHGDKLKEMKTAIKDKLPDLKQRRAELDRLDRAVKMQEKETKKDPSKENRARLKETIRQANEQDRHHKRLEREIEKMWKQYHSLNKKNERAMMSPAQLKEARRVDSLIRKLG